MSDNDIAIIGMAAHLPGARDTSTYWSNLRDGVESVRPLSDNELAEAGVRAEAMRQPGYVRAAATLDGVFDFDAEFFGLSPKEAAIMDPQHRHFLMAAWEAIEDAGHPPETFDGAIGVFAGSGMASYFALNLISNRELVRDVGMFLLRHTGNDKDFLSTRASYLFNLRGPSMNVQTACSTSLVAVHLAVQHLLAGECDMALAGGVTIEIPHGRGYQYEEGEILSPDGHCRAFDHRSAGTVFGSGAGVVALRRLDDALADGDQIYAVIKGTAVNNDGAQKVGYLAPSVDGQAACITEALAVAEVDGNTIDYVECHGTGTPMGDPIEVAALTQAFRATSDEVGYCRIGSVKTNIGHLDTAAGVASLIKVALALQHRQIPPSLNYERSNPSLDLESSPFLVNETLTDWSAGGDVPRRAGVNSLGVGGTNAFAVIEEAPARLAARADKGGWHLLTLTGRNRGALDDNTARLARHLREHPEIDIADVAFTLQVGRRHFAERRVVAVRDSNEAIALMEAKDPHRVFTHSASSADRQLVFMFPGGGTQYPRMGADLHRDEPVFGHWVDEGLRLLEQHHGLDLRPTLFPDDEDTFERAADQLAAMRHQLPLIFIIEHAMAQMLIERGHVPTAMVGHSLGENTAACVAGTLSFEDALGLVVLRGQLMDRVPGGALAVSLSPDDIEALIVDAEVDLAVVNGPDLCVVSGTVEHLDALDERLRADGVDTTRVQVSTPVHSRMLDPVLDEFRVYLESIELRPPSMLWVSNRTGTWITPEQAVDPQYWVDHLRNTVRFSDCLATLAADPSIVLLEVGPGKSLSSLAKAHPELKSSQAAIPTMRHASEVVDDSAAMLAAIGRLWAVGAELDFERNFGGADLRRIALPTYAFQTQRYYIEPSSGGINDQSANVDELPVRDDESRWFWKSVWRSQDCDDAVAAGLSWLVVVDQDDIGDQVVSRLRARGDDVVVARCGDSFQALSDDEYMIAPELGLPTYESLVKELTRTGRLPDRVAHLALVADDEQVFRPGSSFFHRNQELGFQSLVFLAQAWATAGLQRPLHIAVATVGSQRVLDTDRPAWPEQSTVLGPVLVIPREFADVTVSTFDLDPDDLAPPGRLRNTVEAFRTAVRPSLAARGIVSRDGGVTPTRRDVALDAVVDELLAPAVNQVVAIRRDRRFVHDVRRTTIADDAAPRLRQRGVAVITGGLGGIGLTVADALFADLEARVALVSRTPLPAREDWDELLERLGASHPTAVRIVAVRALEARGAEVMLLSGDVTDVEQMRAALSEVRQRFGSIDAVVHGAGVVDDALMMSKPHAEMEDVLAPKVYGTLVLEELTHDDDLDLFVVFSSTSTVTAPMGQVDYVAANAFLNAFASSRRAAGHDHVVAVNWGVWNEVGMAATAASDDTVDDVGPETSPTSHPFFTERSTDRNGVVTLSSEWPTDTTWFLADHRTAAGEALMPGSGYLELARAALGEIGIDRPFEIRDLTFLRPLAAADGGGLGVRTVLTPTEEGYSLVVNERVKVGGASAEDESVAGREGWRRAAEATLLLYRQTAPDPVDLDECRRSTPHRANPRSRQHEHLRFGPRWDVMDEVRTGQGVAVARLELPERFATDVSDFGLHPALVDLGTGFAMDIIPGYSGDQLWVPVDYRRIRVVGRLSSSIVSVVRLRAGSEANGFASFDVQLCSPDGEVLVVIEAFTIKRLDGALDVGAQRRVLASELEPDPAGRRHQRSQAELVLQHNVEQGIRPEEGKRAFLKTLGAGVGPVVYASSLDLAALRHQSVAIAAAQTRDASVDTSAVFGRPDLDSEFVAPRNDIEENLVAMWQELLGISQIGVHDNFFDLGGHSLIAVRLFARVKRTFSVEFPISVLFEAPTIEACAELIAAAMPMSDAVDTDSTIVTPTPRYRHLVSMHPGEGGPNPPFFLVAGMFGNVLNLRHLAHQIGTDRPFYGVQARGLFGDEAPHDDFLDMAKAYVDEVRTVQPHGPYLLGGFSGGGIVALEMARLLRDDGEEIGLLVMLDTPVPDNPELTTTEKVRMHAQRLRTDGPSYVSTWLCNRLRWERQMRHRRRHGIEAPTGEGVLHSTVIEAGFNRALDRYEMRYYGGVITLFRPRLTPLHVFGPDRQIDPFRRFVYHDNGWGPYCEAVRVTEVPGDHDGMVLEPSVRVLAGHIRSELEILDAAHQQSETEVNPSD